MVESMTTLMGLLIGIGLSAACGFRIFVPLLGMSIANRVGHVALAPGFEWIGSWPALVAFSTATVLEVAAYHVPWLDHALDVVGAPIAIAGGTLMTASLLGNSSPLLRWSLAAVAGGGISTVVHGGMAVLRAASTGTTAGLGNFLLSTLELLAAIGVTLLAILVPIVCFVVVLWICARMILTIVKVRTPGPTLPESQ
jgi:Domain of unknown function (DUF4126)